MIQNIVGQWQLHGAFFCWKRATFYLSNPLFFHVLADYFVSFGQSRMSHEGEHFCDVLLAVLFCVLFQCLVLPGPYEPVFESFID